MALISAIKSRIRQNLNDNGVTFYSTEDLDDSFQDAYDDIAFLSRCIIKKRAVSKQANLSYYALADEITDLMAPIAIYDPAQSKFLLDDKTLRDFELENDSWELRTGTPTHWAALDHKYTALYPRYASVTSGSPTDAFTRANASDLNSSDWTNSVNTNGSYIKIASNAVEVLGQGVAYRPDSYGQYQRSKFTLRQNSGAVYVATTRSGPMVRFSGSYNNASFYCIEVLTAGATHLKKYVNADLSQSVTGSSITSPHAVVSALGDTLEIEATGNTVNLYRNGSVIQTVTDYSIGSGYIGLATIDTTVNDTLLSRWDDFEGYYTPALDVYYWAVPPVFADSDSPLVATDLQRLFDNYCVGDLLEQAEEYAKANPFWKEYFRDIDIYLERIQRLSKTALRSLS